MNFFSQRNISLLRELVRTDFKLRYQGSVLGYLWSLLRPLMLFGVLYIVFTKVIKLGGKVPHYPAYLLLGIVLWTYFIEATVMGMNSIVGRGELIRKVSMPKYTIVLSACFSAFVNLFFNLIVVFIFMLITRVTLQWEIIYLPLLLLELVAFSASIAFLLSAMFVKYRDMVHIWEVILQVLFYATPIIYPLLFVPLRYARIMALSPLTQIIQDARYIMITKQATIPSQVLPPAVGWLAPPIIVGLVAVLGGAYFRHNSKSFAENI